jgi:hypothetical protein
VSKGVTGGVVLAVNVDSSDLEVCSSSGSIRCGSFGCGRSFSTATGNQTESHCQSQHHCNDLFHDFTSMISFEMGFPLQLKMRKQGILSPIFHENNTIFLYQSQHTDQQFDIWNKNIQ